MNSEAYSAIASEVFAPLYPYYASLIVDQTGIHSGKCLDIGCGGGHLGLALAADTDLTVSLLDQSNKAIRIARQNIRERGMEGRVNAVVAQVESLPFSDEFFDLAVSRGSVPFWQDLTAAFAEIFRVLKPGGQAYIGGGLGSPEIREKIRSTMRERDPEWHKEMPGKIPHRSVEEYCEALSGAGIRNFKVDRGDEGTWIRFQKATNRPE